VKLIIQIPCYNEEEYISFALSNLPSEIEGVDTVEYLVVDDGSTDGTAEAAKRAGAHHVLRLDGHKGLAGAFTAGLKRSLELGADIIVNTDADNQYNADDTAGLVEPIVSGRSGMVIGARPISEIAHFSFVKKMLQKLGSAVVRLVSGMPVEDAPSGFRAISRETALRLNIFTDYTYTLESIIQAGSKGINIMTVPVRVNEKQRESRLVKSSLSYVIKSLRAIVWVVLIYNPSKVFNRLGVALFAAGFLLGVRFIYYFLTGEGTGHIQSLILLSVLITLGLGSILLSAFAGLISVNRRLSEDIQYRLRKLEYEEGGPGE